MCKVKSFCGLYSLRNGCFVIAIVHLVYAGIFLIVTSGLLTFNVPELIVPDKRRDQNALMSFLIISLYIHASDVAMNAIFFFTVIMHVKRFYQPYLIYCVVIMIVNFLRVLATAAFFIASVILFLPYLFIRIYCFVVVFSYYLHEHAAKKEEEATTTDSNTA